MKRAEEEGVPVEELQFAEGELDPGIEVASEEQASTAESGNSDNGPGTVRSGMAKSIERMGFAVKSSNAKSLTGKLTAADVANMIRDEKAKKKATEGK